ncbi:MAG TPA: MBL fold metallo-hydrolase [Baekduia sp.]|nr:MBL fold metallo-hydrolase [Baekduia sp.]
MSPIRDMYVSRSALARPWVCPTSWRMWPMQQLADDVWHIPLAPRDGVNAYILGDVLVDAGIKPMGGKAVAAARERGVTSHALTHAHLDHAGGSARVIRELGLDGLAVGVLDAPAVRDGGSEPPPHVAGPLQGIARAIGRFPASPVASELREGDLIGPGSSCSTSPATRRATSRSGARPTGC